MGITISGRERRENVLQTYVRPTAAYEYLSFRQERQHAVILSNIKTDHQNQTRIMSYAKAIDLCLQTLYTSRW